MVLVLTLPTNPSNVLYLLHGCLLCTTNADYWDLTNVIASVSKLLTSGSTIQMTRGE